MRRILSACVTLALAGALGGCVMQQEELAEPDLQVGTEASISESPEAEPEPETETATVTETETEVAEAEPVCSDEVLQRTPGLERMTFFEGCYGAVARAGVPNSDYIVLVTWNGEGWDRVESDGMWDGMGMERPCYAEGRLEKLGFPPEIRDKQHVCGVYGPGQTPPNKL